MGMVRIGVRSYDVWGPQAVTSGTTQSRRGAIEGSPLFSRVSKKAERCRAETYVGSACPTKRSAGRRRFASCGNGSRWNQGSHRSDRYRYQGEAK